MVSVPAVLAICGGIALLLALLGGGFKIRGSSVPVLSRPVRFLSAAVGCLLIVSAVRVPEPSPEPSQPPAQVPSPESVPTPQSTRSTRKPEELFGIVQEQQRANVKESWGEQANQSFTDQDLERFTRTKVTDRIVEALRRDPRFLEVVQSVRTLAPGPRGTLLVAADRPLRPTWAELGRIGREGTTEAGQRAERMIASAIVTLTRDLIALPDGEFQKLYNE